MLGETICEMANMAILKFQSTPLMRGETRLGKDVELLGDISIHSPHARGDVNNGLCDSFYAIFQSTPLIRGET